MTPTRTRELAPRTRRAISAATAAGRDLGLPVSHPQVLHDVFSVMVHLAPAPVVARVPVVLPPGLDQDRLCARQVRELSVAGWLGDAGQKIVRPSPLVPRLPVLRDGFSITLWELVDVEPSRTDYASTAPLIARLHRTLQPYPGDLPFLGPAHLTIPSSLRFLEEHTGVMSPDDLERARQEWDILAPVLASPEAFAATVPGARFQPIHGDAPYYNLIRTSVGPVYADFEDVCLGPVEWDMALAGPEAAAEYDASAADAGVPPLDPAVLRIMNAARMLQLMACLALVPQLPMLAEALAPMREQWRAMPLAGGLT